MEHKWIYELIVEKIPPFSYLPKKYVSLFQLFIMEIAGIVIALHFNLPFSALLYGSLVILVVVLWSLLMLKIAPTIRSFRTSLSEEENRVIEEYKRLLFHPDHYEIVPGIVFMAIASYYLITNPAYLTRFTGNTGTLVYVFIGLLLWDVSYRAGLGIWVGMISLRRSRELYLKSLQRKELEHTLLYDLNSMERLDRSILFFGIISFLLFPVIISSVRLTFLISFYISILFTLSTLSMYYIRRVPWLPPDIFDLLKMGKFAYVGTVESGKPHITPVVYVFDGRFVYFATSRASRKFKNIKNVKRIAVLIDERDPKDLFKNKAVLIRGEAHILGISGLIYALPTLIRVRNLFMKKFQRYMKVYRRDKSKLPRAWQLTPLIRRIPIKIKPEEVIYWRGARMIRIPL